MTPQTPRSADGVEGVIDAWLASELASEELVVNVEKDSDTTRWYVRIRGVERTVTTVWLTLREHSLAYETYFMPSPEENVAQCYEYLLRANGRLHGLRFSIGGEDAVYLIGEVPRASVTADALDAIIGATYHFAEECFPTAMRIGFASRFRRASQEQT